MIDELYIVLAGRADIRRGIPLVGVGTREAYPAICSDNQLENRLSR